MVSIMGQSSKINQKTIFYKSVNVLFILLHPVHIISIFFKDLHLCLEIVT
jgi:hypothetical protein